MSIHTNLILGTLNFLVQHPKRSIVILEEGISKVGVDKFS